MKTGRLDIKHAVLLFFLIFPLALLFAAGSPDFKSKESIGNDILICIALWSLPVSSFFAGCLPRRKEVALISEGVMLAAFTALYIHKFRAYLILLALVTRRVQQAYGTFAFPLEADYAREAVIFPAQALAASIVLFFIGFVLRVMINREKNKSLAQS